MPSQFARTSARQTESTVHPLATAKNITLGQNAQRSSFTNQRADLPDDRHVFCFAVNWTMIKKKTHTVEIKKDAHTERVAHGTGEREALIIPRASDQKLSKRDEHWTIQLLFASPSGRGARGSLLFS
jgi:hypothetical protein